MPEPPEPVRRPPRDIDISRSPLLRWLAGSVRAIGLWLLIVLLMVVAFVLFARAGWDTGWMLVLLPLAVGVVVVAIVGGRLAWVLLVRRGVWTWMRQAWAPAKRMAVGDAAGAEAAFSQALDRARRFDPLDHRRGLMLTELAGFAKNQGRYAQAKELYEECVEILEQHRRTNSIDYFIALNNYAIYFIHLRDYEAAQHRLEDAIDLTLARQKSPGVRQAVAKLAAQVEWILHVNLVFLFSEMGALTEAAEHVAEADELFGQLLKKNRKRLGDHYQAIRALLMYRQGRFVDAAAALDRAENPDHPTCMRVRAKLALVRQDFAQAEELLRRCLVEHRKKGSPHLPEMRDFMLDLGESLFGQNKPDEAFQAVDEARSIVADFQIPPEPRWRRALEGWLARARELGRTETVTALEADLQQIVAIPEQGITVSARLRVRPPID